MSDSPSQKPNRYGFDPFDAVDEIRANMAYGRVDIPSDAKLDTAEAELEAVRATAAKVNPTMDRTLPWTLLMGGMFSFLYGDAEKEENRRAGRKKRSAHDALPRKIKVSAQDWAKAFNMISVRYVDTDFLKRPDVVKKETRPDGRVVKLAVMSQDKGKGGTKTQDYLSPLRVEETRKKLRRMEWHRLEVAEDPRVKKYLASKR
jgi:hypothetical protein